MERLRSSPEQFAALVEFMESHGDLAKPQQGVQGRIRSEKLWGDLAEALNCIGGGVTRTSEKWKKVWADFKTKTKKKAMLIRQHGQRTGGGPSLKLTLSPLEERVLIIIGGVSAVEGAAQVEEFGVGSSSRSQLLASASTAGSPPPPPLESPINEAQQIATSATPPPPSLRLEEQPPITSTEAELVVEQTMPPVEQTAAPVTAAQQPARAAATHQPHPTRRRRSLTPFDRATSEFVEVELRRLELEEMRLRDHHVRETERLRLEAERLRLEEERIAVLRQFTEVLNRVTTIAQTWIDRS